MADSDYRKIPSLQSAVQKYDDVIQLQDGIGGITQLISNLVDGPLERTRRSLFTDTNRDGARSSSDPHGPDYHLNKLEEARDLILDTRSSLLDYYERSTKGLLEFRAKNIEKLHKEVDEAYEAHKARQKEDDEAYEAHKRKRGRYS